MTDDPLLFTCDRGVATLVLNRPAVGNALSLDLCKAMMDAAIRCDEDDSIRCVVLTGAGRMFCSGGDIDAFIAAGDQVPVLLKQLTGHLHMAVSRLLRMEKPLVTAINGAAAGAGLGLALLGDVALAARSARFAAAYGGIGLTPDAGVSWMLPRLAGLRRAQEITLLNRRLSAEEAETMGLITRAVDDDNLAAETALVTGQLLASATRAIGRSRRLLLESFGASLEQHLEMEARAIAASGRDSECREGVAAFVAKRKPDFAHT